MKYVYFNVWYSEKNINITNDLPFLYNRVLANQSIVTYCLGKLLQRPHKADSGWGASTRGHLHQL